VGVKKGRRKERKRGAKVGDLIDEGELHEAV